LLGVASVLALNTGISVMVWRILFLILLPFHGVSLLIYLAVWALTPFRQDGQSLFDRVFRSARYSRTKA
jgi:phage shock protein PspC (stress-responsive transcriptional regulator)